MIAVMGATGQTGSVVADSLLTSGARVRVIGRRADRLASAVARGAEAAVGDVTDRAFLAGAFMGADAVYAMIPPSYQETDLIGHYDRAGAAIAEAIGKSGVSKVVFLSSIGAERAFGTGPIVGLHRQEERLKQLPGIDLLILRPGYFMENLFGSIGLIKSAGINGGAIVPGRAVSLVAVRDIGLAAADALLDGHFKGTSVRELLGERDLTMTEVTRALGEAIGKPGLAYVQFPDEDYAKALVGYGFSRPIADLFIEMSHAISDGRVASLFGRSAASTTRTSIEAFAKGFAAAYAKA